MKRIAIVIFSLFVLLYFVETSNAVGLTAYKPFLEVSQISNEYVFSWPKIPYIAYYEVEVLSQKPDNDVLPVPAWQRIVKYRTWDNTITVNQNFPFRTFWRVSAHGLFQHPLGHYSDAVNLAQVMGIAGEDFTQIRPSPTSPSSAASPAGNKPILTWTSVPGAVYYEFELLSAPPENPNGITESKYRVFATREVFTNGYTPDLSASAASHLYWRVRALDYDGNPLGVFSDAADLFFNARKNEQLAPKINVEFNRDNMPVPLYPAYSWIPVCGASTYEVEVTSQPPENPHGTQPSQYRLWSKTVTGFDCYDDEPRSIPGTYYWRVRGLDDNGRAVGVYSDASPFTVDVTSGNYAATFGDSITHGGGAISYSPANWEYSFQTYLNFTAVNLGKSGDTSETMVERFDRDVLPYHPKFLIILGGTNSLRGGTPADQVIHDLASIRDKCYANNIRPIFLTLPPINPDAIERAFSEETMPNWREEFDKVNQFIRQQQYYIDLDPFFNDANRELPDHFAIDGLHPDIEGKKLMAQIINANWYRVTRE